MNSATKTLDLPSLTADSLSQANLNIDNTFSSTWKSIGFNIMLRQATFSKRSGTPVGDLTYLLMLWVWLKVDTVAMFSKDALLRFSAAKKDALYDLLNREDLARLSDVRNGFEESLNCLNFASKLWGLFKALIAGALNEMNNLTSVDKSGLLKKIEETVVDFFTQVMQMDSFTLRQEALE